MRTKIFTLLLTLAAAALRKPHPLDSPGANADLGYRIAKLFPNPATPAKGVTTADPLLNYAPAAGYPDAAAPRGGPPLCCRPYQPGQKCPQAPPSRCSSSIRAGCQSPLAATRRF